MTLSPLQIEQFKRDGFLLIGNVFSALEVDIVKAELPELLRADTAGRVLEKDSRLVRSVYGSHRTNTVCHQLTRHPRLLRPAMRLLDSLVYVYQFKINVKAAFGGDRWDWHQDYIFWRNEDAMPSDRVLNLAVYLDDVTEFNGPIFLLPGSHREGVIEPIGSRSVRAPADSAAWLSHVTTGLKYALDLETMKSLVSKWGLFSAKATAGSVLVFHPNLVHGSSPNMSPFDRAVAIVTVNSTKNALPDTDHPRPEFLAGRDSSPLAALPDDVWTKPRPARCATELNSGTGTREKSGTTLQGSV